MPGRLAAAEPAAATAAETSSEADSQVRQLLWDAQQKRDAGQTTEALAALRSSGVLDAREHKDLEAAYDFLRTLINGLRILSVPQEWQITVTGLIVIFSVYADILRRRK